MPHGGELAQNFSSTTRSHMSCWQCVLYMRARRLSFSQPLRMLFLVCRPAIMAALDRSGSAVEVMTCSQVSSCTRNYVAIAPSESGPSSAAGLACSYSSRPHSEPHRTANYFPAASHPAVVCQLVCYRCRNLAAIASDLPLTPLTSPTPCPAIPITPVSPPTACPVEGDST